MDRFFAHFLKNENNGWQQRSRVTVWWDAKVSSRTPSWTPGLDHWSERNRLAEGKLTPYVLNLRADGGLTTAPAAPAEGTDTYTHTPGLGSQSIGNPYYDGTSTSTPLGPIPPNRYIWAVKPAPGTSAPWTTAPVPAEPLCSGPLPLTPG